MWVLSVMWGHFWPFHPENPDYLSGQVGVQGMAYCELSFGMYCDLWKSRFKPFLSEI